MSIRPTGHRILVKPDEQRTETDSGLVLLQDRHHIPVSGTVVAIGSGPLWAAQLKREILKDVRDIIEGTGEIFPNDGGAPFNILRDEIGRYAQRMPYASELQVGDRVIFPTTSGHNLTLDGEDLIELVEDDVLGYEREEEEAVA